MSDISSKRNNTYGVVATTLVAFQNLVPCVVDYGSYVIFLFQYLRD